MTGPEGCRQEAAPSAGPRRSASAARRHIAQTHYRGAVRRKRRGCGSVPGRTAFGACRRGGCSDCRPATTGGVDAGGGNGLAAGCGPSAAVRANSGGHVQRRNRPRRAPDGLIAGGSAARRLGGSAARRLGGSAARRLGGSAARRLGGSAARRLGGSAARRLGGSAARRLILTTLSAASVKSRRKVPAPQQSDSTKSQPVAAIGPASGPVNMPVMVPPNHCQRPKNRRLHKIPRLRRRLAFYIKCRGYAMMT